MSGRNIHYIFAENFETLNLLKCHVWKIFWLTNVALPLATICSPPLCNNSSHSLQHYLTMGSELDFKSTQFDQQQLDQNVKP